MGDKPSPPPPRPGHFEKGVTPGPPPAFKPAPPPAPPPAKR